jgi:hypothetical protein
MRPFIFLALLSALELGAQTPDPSQSHLPKNKVAAHPELPTLFIVGDSTVRNGQGDGSNGQWGVEAR